MAAADDWGAYESDPEPIPRDGDHGTCVCGDRIRYIDSPHGAEWAHDEDANAGHEAELGGPA